MSRIGRLPVAIPDKVEIKVSDTGSVTVKGPKGELTYDMPAGLEAEQKDGKIIFSRVNERRESKALHGTARSLVSNMVKGVTEGFSKELEIIGVGYRAAVKGKNLDLQLGFSHPVSHPIPEGLTVTVQENTKLKVEGIDKQLVGQFSAEVRSYRPPEPYKGKGVRYTDEYVRRKAGKSVK
ncbi:MAG: 50S ribosomal protein L6 [Verrucomicrobiota bacterium]